MSRLLYHYCNLSNFKKIIETGTIRLSELGKSSDYMEMLWLKNKIVPKMILKRFEKINYSFPVEFELDGSIYKGEKGINRMLEWFVDREDKDKMYEALTLGCCFSQDGDLLSQWRGYADDGQGVSIGFDQEILESKFNFKNKHISQRIFRLEKVRYVDNGEDIDCKLDQELINSVDSFISGLKSINEIGTNEIDLNDVINKFLLEISCLAPIYKNCAFNEENEWRAFVNFLYPAGRNPNEVLVGELRENLRMPRFSELKSFTRNSKIIFYIDFNWVDIDWIKNIYIGPRCDAGEDDIKKLLASSNVKNSEQIRIIKSKASYR